MIENIPNWQIHDLASKHDAKLLEIPKDISGKYIDAFGKPISFNGNYAIKSENVKLNLNKYHVEELIKCAEDVHYFIFNYCKVLTAKGYAIPELRPYQEKLLKAILSGNRIVANYPRQSGKTTVVYLIILWMVNFNFGAHWGLTSNNASGSREILSKLKKTFVNLPIWMQQGIRIWNTSKIELENESYVLTSATNVDSFRGYSLVGGNGSSGLYSDEVAFIDGDRWYEFSDAVMPTVSTDPDAKIILSSTPNGFNHFFDIVKNAKNQSNGYKCLEMLWNEVPNRDEHFKTKIIKESGKTFWHQNYECSFVGSSLTLLDGEIFNKFKIDMPILEENFLRIYENPRKGIKYILLIDVASGCGADRTVIQIIKILKDKFVQVGIFQSDEISIRLLPRIIYDLGVQYNMAHVLFEINFGEEVASRLYYDLEYENLVTVAKDAENQKAFGFKGKFQLGLRQNKRIKKDSLLGLKNLIEKNKLILRDGMTIGELMTFVANGSSYEAESGKHDDTVMALALLGWLVNQEGFLNIAETTIVGDMDDENTEEATSVLSASLFSFGAEESF